MKSDNKEVYDIMALYSWNYNPGFVVHVQDTLAVGQTLN